MKKATVLLLVLSLVLAMFAGCGSTKTEAPEPAKTETEAPKKEEVKVENTDAGDARDNAGTIDTGKAEVAEGEAVIADEVTIAVSTDINVDPWNSWNEPRQHFMPILYQTLGEYNADSENGMMGILMKDFEDLGNQTYRVTIYDYIYDSAGNHLTADDVVFSFNGFIKAGKSVKTKVIESVTAIDDYTVEIKLNTPSMGEIEGLLCNQVFIVTQAAYEASPDGMASQPISTSPYKVTEFVSGSSLTLEARDDYWQTDATLTPPGQATNAKKITYLIIRENSQVSINLESGNIDAANVSSYEVTRFQEGGASSEGFTAITAKIPKFWFMYFNMAPGQGMFADSVEARQAIAYAVDVEGLIDGAFDGYAEPVYTYGCTTAMDFNPEWDKEVYGYDPAKAEELIASSGLKDKGPIRIVTNNSETYKILSQTIQAYLNSVGLEVEIQLLESALLNTTVTDPTAWDICLTEKTCHSYYSEVANVWSQKTPCLSLAEDDTLEDLITKVRNAETHDEYIDEYVYYLRDNCFAYTLFTIYNNYVVKDGIAGVYLNFKGYMMPNAFTYTAEINK